MKESGRGSLSVFWAVLAAALYAVNAPVAKLLLEDVEPAMMAGLLYLGAGAGMLLLGIARRGTGRGGEEKRLARRDLPYTAGMTPPCSIILRLLRPLLWPFLSSGRKSAAGWDWLWV